MDNDNFDHEMPANTENPNRPTEAAASFGSKNGSAQPNPSGPMPVYVPTYVGQVPKKSGFRTFLKVIFVAVLIFSFFLNLMLIGVVAIQAGATGQDIIREGNVSTKIAVINLSGTVDMKMASHAQEMLSNAAKDRTIKAVVLEVNSPGGAVVPSDMIKHEILKFKDNTGKKVYVSIQQVGASGAYWYSVAADKIYAQTDSVVGSIGVIHINMIFEQALKEKLGVEPMIIKSTRSPFKAYGNPFEKPDAQAIAKIQQDLDDVHKRFVQVVCQGRGLTEDAVWNLAAGDVYDGIEAKNNQLIDKVGFLDDALVDLAGSLGLNDYMVIRLNRRLSIMESMLAEAKASPETKMIERLNDFLRCSSGVQVIDERYLLMEY
ncbi:MAG: signal peptide peptidase SppA [Phycisphaerae bacterium]|nr:signal peptide peptidase SppA [Phycisphaerae bacterium]